MLLVYDSASKKKKEHQCQISGNSEPICQIVKKSYQFITLGDKMEDIYWIEDGEGHPIVCRAMFLLLFTIMMIMKNAEKIKSSVQ